jgi:hypothetical protein
VAEQLCVLDNSIGLSVSRIVLKKFQFLRTTIEPEVVEEDSSETEIMVPSAPLTLAAGAMGNGEGVSDF